MAIVPTVPDRVQPAAPAPTYQAPAVPAAAFGALQAQSLESAGPKIEAASTQLYDAAAQQQARTDAVARSRDMASFNQQAQTQLQNMSTAGDITDPATTAAYNDQMTQLLNQTVQSHAGSPDSAAILATQLNNDRTGYVSRAASMQQTAQGQQIDQVVGQQMSPITNAAYMGSGNLQDLLKQADGVVQNMAPAIGTAKAQAYSNQGRQQVVRASVQGMIDRGQIDQAQQFMQANGALMTPDTQLFLNNHVTMAQAQIQRDKSKTNDTIMALKSVGASNAQIAAALGGGSDPVVQQQNLFSARMAELTQIHDGDASKITPQEKLAAMGFSQLATAVANPFGNTASGRAQNIIGSLLPGYENNLLGPDGDLRFEQAVLALKPQLKLDPQTNTYFDPTNQLPPQVIAALQQRGTLQKLGVLQQGQVAPSPALATPAASPAATPSPAPAPAAGNPATAPQAANAPSGGPTVWGLSDTGALNAVGQFAHTAAELPIIGNLAVGSEKAVQAHQYVSSVSNQLLDAFKQDKNLSPEELTKIEHETDFAPHVGEATPTYKARLIGIDDALAARASYYSKQAVDPQVGADARRTAAQIVARIGDSRASLGVPPKLTTREQIQQLQPNQPFRWKDGKVHYRSAGQ